MNRAEIEATIKGAVGDPTSGAVADAIPAIVHALDSKLNGKPGKTDTRVVAAEETR
jgi:hypothetical protein